MYKVQVYLGARSPTALIPDVSGMEITYDTDWEPFSRSVAGWQVNCAIVVLPEIEDRDLRRLRGLQQRRLPHPVILVTRRTRSVAKRIARVCLHSLVWLEDVQGELPATLFAACTQGHMRVPYAVP